MLLRGTVADLSQDGDVVRADHGLRSVLDQRVQARHVVLVVEAGVVNVADTERLLDCVDALREEAHSGDHLVQTVGDAGLGRRLGVGERVQLLSSGLDDSASGLSHIALDLAAQGHDVVLESDEGAAMVLLVQADGVVDLCQLARDGAQVGPQRRSAAVTGGPPGALEVDAPGLEERAKVGSHGLILDGTRVGVLMELHETVLLGRGRQLVLVESRGFRERHGE